VPRKSNTAAEKSAVHVSESGQNARLHAGVDTLDGVPLVKEAIRVLSNLPGRLIDTEGRPGGLVIMPQEKRPIIIGDLHANRENLALILAHENNREDMETGTAACILVGDAFHDDRTGHMKDMHSSVEILDDVLRLIVRYSGRVYYIRGNHDTFDERLRKSGIMQGIEFKNALLREKGAEYTAAVSDFFDSMPVFIIGQNFVVTHAGPPRGGIVRDELVNIRRYPEKFHQLIWTRVNEFHGNPSLKEYGEKDLRLALDLLEMPIDTHFIVGHNPIWSDGNTTGVWLNVIGIKNHHILYSGYGSRAPYITFVNDQMIVKYAQVKQPEVYYYG
jgi:predicted phosphodiesterase